MDLTRSLKKVKARPYIIVQGYCCSDFHENSGKLFAYLWELKRKGIVCTIPRISPIDHVTIEPMATSLLLSYIVSRKLNFLDSVNCSLFFSEYPHADEQFAYHHFQENRSSSIFLSLYNLNIILT